MSMALIGSYQAQAGYLFNNTDSKIIVRFDPINVPPLAEYERAKMRHDKYSNYRESLGTKPTPFMWPTSWASTLEPRSEQYINANVPGDMYTISITAEGKQPASYKHLFKIALSIVVNETSPNTIAATFIETFSNLSEGERAQMRSKYFSSYKQ